jgi:hypothetical protein
MKVSYFIKVFQIILFNNFYHLYLQNSPKHYEEILDGKITQDK